MNLPDVTELRDLIRYMKPAERDEVRRTICGSKWDLTRLSFHELGRFQHLGEKLTAAWPYCSGIFSSLTLTELFVALDDDEMRDYLNLCWWVRGGERPADHPLIAEDNQQARRTLDRAYRPDQPLREAQGIVSEGEPNV